MGGGIEGIRWKIRLSRSYSGERGRSVYLDRAKAEIPPSLQLWIIPVFLVSPESAPQK